MIEDLYSLHKTHFALSFGNDVLIVQRLISKYIRYILHCDKISGAVLIDLNSQAEKYGYIIDIEPNRYINPTHISIVLRDTSTFTEKHRIRSFNIKKALNAEIKTHDLCQKLIKKSNRKLERIYRKFRMYRFVFVDLDKRYEYLTKEERILIMNRMMKIIDNTFKDLN